MTVDPLDLELQALFAERQAHGVPVELEARVRSIPAAHAARQRPSRWRGPTIELVGGLRFAAALLVVVAVGGFLLQSLLPARPESEGVSNAHASAGSTAEASPRPTPTPRPVKDVPVPSTSVASAGPTSPPPRRSVSGPVWSSLPLVTDEVEPGVLHVESDGVRSLTRDGFRPTYAKVAGSGADAIAAGRDGSVWLLWPGDGFFRLGDGETQHWSHDLELTPGFPRVRVAPDGSLWTIGQVRGADGAWIEGLGALERFADGAWDLRATHVDAFDIDSGGVVWVVQRDDSRSSIGRALPEGVVRDVEFDPGTTIEDIVADPASPPDPTGRKAFWIELWVRTSDGDVTAIEGGDGTWGWGSPEVPGRATAFDVGPDGTVWEYLTVDTPALGQTDQDSDVGSVSLSYLARRGPQGGWAVSGSDDGVPDTSPSFLRVAPDGAVWLGQNEAERGLHYCDGISRFDGSSWRHYLADRCVTAVDIAPDGSVWLVAGDQPASGEISSLGTYLIPAESPPGS